MRCIGCGSAAVTERPERAVQGYRRFRCRSCGKQFNERTGTVLNRAQYPSDVIALVVLWRLRYKLSLRDLPEMFLVRRALCNILSSRLNFKLFPADRKLGSDSAPDNPCCSVRRSDGALISAV